MIASSATRVGLVALLERLLEIPVQWRGEPQKVVVGASATIDEIGDEVGLGVDEVSYAEGPTEEAPTEVTPTVYGLRETSLQVSVWSPSQRVEESARFYTSRLRTRLRWPSAIEELRALDLGIVTIGSSIKLDVEQSSRLRSGSALEIRISWGVAEEDTAVPFMEEARIYTVADADGGASLLNHAGEPFPDSMQADINPEP